MLGLQFYVAVVAVQLDYCLASVVFQLFEVFVICEGIALVEFLVAKVFLWWCSFRFDGRVWVNQCIANVDVIKSIWIVWHLDIVDVEGAATGFGVCKSNHVAMFVFVRNFEWCESFPMVLKCLGERSTSST